MLFKTITNQKLPFFVALGLMAVLTSCGSFQYAGYDNDGIYSDSYQKTEVEQPVATTSTTDSNYYKNYFSENSAEVDAINEESEIFTDIDSYEGDYIERTQDTLEQRPAYGGWGQNNSTVTINVIDNGWYGWNDPWLWNGGFGWGQPWGWNRWGNNWGWNRWGWNAGFGWNSGFGWNNWGWNSGWGNGWNNWGRNAWCPPGYNNLGWSNRNFRNNARYAYNGGRRGLLYNNNLSRNTRSNSAISRRNYSTSRLSANTTNRTRSTSRIRSNSNPSTRSIGNTTRTTRSSGTVRSSSPSRTRTNTRVTRPTRSTRSSGAIRSTRSTRSSGSVRSSRSSRSSSGSVRSSGSRSSSRSSGSVRSSSSSSRSSGGSRSSSGRRGRG